MNNKKDIDAFWDISDLVPKTTRKISPSSKSTSAVELTFGHSKANSSQGNDLKIDTVIHRVIAPDNLQGKQMGDQKPTEFKSYIPKNSLIHSVKVYFLRKLPQ